MCIGGICGAIFWTKFSVLGFYSGLVLFVIIWNLSQKKWYRLAKTIMLFLCGFIISCVPELIYCSVTNSFIDMANVYFIGNVFGKHLLAGSFGVKYALVDTIYRDLGVAIIVLLGTFLAVKKKNTLIKVLIILVFVSTFLASCCLQFFVRYYAIPMLAFIPIGIVVINNLYIRWAWGVVIVLSALIIHLFASVEFILYSPIVGDKINYSYLLEYFRLMLKSVIPLLLLLIIKKCKLNVSGLTVSAVCVPAFVVLTLCAYMVRDPMYFVEKEFPHLQFAKTIKQIDNAKILVYNSLDHGFNRAANTYPQVKYFCGLNLVMDDTEQEQLNYIRNEVVDFIVPQGFLLCVAPVFGA